MKQAHYACMLTNTTNETRNTTRPLSIYNLESKAKRDFSLYASTPSSRRYHTTLSNGLPGRGMSVKPWWAFKLGAVRQSDCSGYGVRRIDRREHKG